MELTIDCVWYYNRRDFMKFLKNCEDYTDTIDYYLIKDKLYKSDINNVEPTDNLIGLHIIKKLEACFSTNVELEQEVQYKKILYVIKNLKAENVLALKETIEDFYKNKYSFNLIIINRDDFPKKGVLSLFDNVKFIDN